MTSASTIPVIGAPAPSPASTPVRGASETNKTKISRFFSNLFSSHDAYWLRRIPEFLFGRSKVTVLARRPTSVVVAENAWDEFSKAVLLLAKNIGGKDQTNLASYNEAFEALMNAISKCAKDPQVEATFVEIMLNKMKDALKAQCRSIGTEPENAKIMHDGYKVSLFKAIFNGNDSVGIHGLIPAAKARSLGLDYAKKCVAELTAQLLDADKTAAAIQTFRQKTQELNGILTADDIKNALKDAGEDVKKALATPGVLERLGGKLPSPKVAGLALGAPILASGMIYGVFKASKFFTETVVTQQSVQAPVSGSSSIGTSIQSVGSLAWNSLPKGSLPIAAAVALTTLTSYALYRSYNAPGKKEAREQAAAQSAVLSRQRDLIKAVVDLKKEILKTSQEIAAMEANLAKLQGQQKAGKKEKLVDKVEVDTKDTVALKAAKSQLKGAEKKAQSLEKEATQLLRIDEEVKSLSARIPEAMKKLLQKQQLEHAAAQSLVTEEIDLKDIESQLTALNAEIAKFQPGWFGWKFKTLATTVVFAGTAAAAVMKPTLASSLWSKVVTTAGPYMSSAAQWFMANYRVYGGGRL